MSRVVVLGGGYVGQLVQYAHPGAVVYDWKKEPPRDHLETRIGPQFLWEPIPGVMNREFDVMTLVDGQPPTPEKILAYKKKVGKEDDDGNWVEQFREHRRGFHAYLPVPNIIYNMMAVKVDLSAHHVVMRNAAVIPYDTLISTIPLPSLLEITTFIELGESDLSGFRMDPIFMKFDETSSEENGMRLNYLSTPHVPYYRVTTFGKKIFYEALTAQPGSKKIYPGKIHAHPGSETVLKSLRNYDVYCYGRFATWRPDELAHETWREIAGATWRTN